MNLSRDADVFLCVQAPILADMPTHIKETTILKLLAGINFLFKVADEEIYFEEWHLGMTVHLIVNWYRMPSGLTHDVCLRLRAFVLLAQVSCVIIKYSTNGRQVLVEKDFVMTDIERLKDAVLPYCAVDEQCEDGHFDIIYLGALDAVSWSFLPD